MHFTKQSLSYLPESAQSLLLESGKQFLPYEYISSLSKLNETSLPPKAAFYSSLSDNHISDEEYTHALKVWEACKCNTLMDYLKLYLEMDVGLLADVYLQWRQTLLDLFKLDCLYFLTLPSYAIEAAFLQSKIKLDCVSDPNMYQLLSRNIRGGFCSVGRRYVKANNKHVNANFVQGSKSNYLLYIDFNSLYPTCMSKFKLPQSNFQELSPSEQEEFLSQDLTQVDVDGEVGYYLHIDTLPIDHDTILKTDSFPLCLSNLDVKETDISDFSKSLLEQCNLKVPKPNKKLIAHHLGVKDYLISLPLLQFLLSKGLKIDKVHKVYKFKQSSFLKSFIENNIKRRAQANNPFIKNAIKLINNAIYGRTLLNKLHYATET